ncbi:alpha/beta hydrolase [Roseateles koreensis]|uniref:Alpha/beta hydrolase n=1 Tax=Roseateles koreensis TaxID=2987526 RepID=A0ABT5KTU3_9BURK|nr:alpha/beta hydrolase [Roseateles koreensis]MDC8785241.1 alpha/beta hydrolase [Roseateles koreensis]
MTGIEAPDVGSLATPSAAIQQLLADIGPRWAADINHHRDQMVRAYTPLLAAHSLPGLRVTRDLPYGTHTRQRLDLYQGQDQGQGPETGSAAAQRPIMMFVHGGAFVRGQKDSNDQVYGNVARLFARHGWLGVNVEYRLAPEAPFPAGALDVGLAVDWVRAHAAEFSGDASRIVLMGHSAGGAHVASYLCDPRCRPNRPKIAGAILVSARLRADVRPDNPNAQGVIAYFGADEMRYAADSAVSHAQHLNVPTLLAVAEYENPWLDVYAAEFCHQAGLAQGRIPRLICVPRHNHTSIVAHLDSACGDDTFGEALLDFARHLPPCPS